MQKNELIKHDNSVFRVLEIRDNSVLLVDCLHKSMPKWNETTPLEPFSVIAENELSDITGKNIPDYDSLSREHRRFVHEHFTLINLKPEMYSFSSHAKIWWRGKCGHEWMQIIKNRTLANAGCPVCSGREVLSGFNDLATKSPEVVALWHPSKNSDLTPARVTSRSNRKVWWKCAEGHEWQTSSNGRTNGGSRCPVCVRKREKNNTLKPLSIILLPLLQHSLQHSFEKAGECEE